MVLEGNNYDLDTLLIYQQDGEITAQQLIEHASEDMGDEYLNYLIKKGLDPSEENAQKFLDWWQDEERDIEEEDILTDDEPSPLEDEEEVFPWVGDETMMEEMKKGPQSHAVFMWRLKNPMSRNRELCARETGLPLSDIEKWWFLPNYIEEKNEVRLTLPEGFSSQDIVNLLL